MLAHPLFFDDFCLCFYQLIFDDRKNFFLNLMKKRHQKPIYTCSSLGFDTTTLIYVLISKSQLEKRREKEDIWRIRFVLLHTFLYRNITGIKFRKLIKINLGINLHSCQGFLWTISKMYIVVRCQEQIFRFFHNICHGLLYNICYIEVHVYVYAWTCWIL